MFALLYTNTVHYSSSHILFLISPQQPVLKTFPYPCTQISFILQKIFNIKYGRKSEAWDQIWDSACLLLWSVKGTCFPLNAHTGAQGNVQVIHQVPLERGDAGSLLSLGVSICPYHTSSASFWQKRRHGESIRMGAISAWVRVVFRYSVLSEITGTNNTFFSLRFSSSRSNCGWSLCTCILESGFWADQLYHGVLEDQAKSDVTKKVPRGCQETSRLYSEY